MSKQIAAVLAAGIIFVFFSFMFWYAGVEIFQRKIPSAFVIGVATYAAGVAYYIYQIYEKLS